MRTLVRVRLGEAQKGADCYSEATMPKHQTPNTKHQKKSKHQPSNNAATLVARLSTAVGVWKVEGLLVFGVWCLVFGAAFAAVPLATNTPSRNIGIEGNVSVALPRADYRPRPLDDRTELILRIESITALTNGQHRYDFYYMGLEPGTYKVADYLVRPDGSRPDELGEIRIQVRALLPEDHNGQLNAYVPRLFPFIGGYRAMLLVLGVVWAGGIAVFIIASRKKREMEVPALVTPPPSLAERLRPLVEAAAAGQLSVEGQATLERLLMGYWREKLNLPQVRMTDALVRLKAHAEAGELLRALERWLHRPGGVAKEEIAPLLQPYRNAPAVVRERASV
jgi:hypothetical protein